MTESQIAVWDFRYNADTFKDHFELIDTLKGVAKKYVFQLEQSDTGYRHYQGRLSLIKKRRRAEKHLILKLFKDKPPNYIEPTTNKEVCSGSHFYVMKEDTREEGPWADTDPPPPTLTKQLERFMKRDLYLYQKQVIALSQIFDDRKIDLLYDPHGNIGKSMLSEYMEFRGLAEEIPPFRLMDDIFQWVCTRPILPAYIIDMPRGMKKDKLADLYSGIEVIKNGVAYDKRYTAKKIRFDRPRIFVFTNVLPCFDLMSKDRWNVWTIDENKELQVYESPAQDLECEITEAYFNINTVKKTNIKLEVVCADDSEDELERSPN